ncbi:cysteine dioxygenase [Saccharothrix carnea]|nr:cysteine dioxygenase family protein [Saccharothrix carnea]
MVKSLERPTPSELITAVDRVGVTVAELRPYLSEPGLYPYGRQKLLATDEVEIIAMNWATQRQCSPHDHGSSFGVISVVQGTISHDLYTLDQDDTPAKYLSRVEKEGTNYFAARGMVHSMGNPLTTPAVTLHFYAPPITRMKVYDLENCLACVVSDDCGAWWPTEQRQRLAVLKLTRKTGDQPRTTGSRVVDPGRPGDPVLR